MDVLIKTIFEPPPMPYIEIPLVLRAVNPHFREDLHNLFNTAYYCGVRDGAVAVAILGIVVILVVSVINSKQKG